MKIIHFYPNFDNVGGAQSMVFTLFEGMKAKNHAVKICGFTTYDNIHSRYKKQVTREEYIEFSFLKIKRIKKSILISHHRKITTYLVLFSKILFSKHKIIHIAHSEFFTLQKLTIFPKKIIAVSHSVKQNLINEFGVDSNQIKVIYNGLVNDFHGTNAEKPINSKIKIVYPARIDAKKQQINLVREIQKTDIDNVIITFCGVGELFNDLKKEVGNDSRFIIKGMVDNMEKEYKKAHFTILFSAKEGLPLSLIESCKYGLPIICNNIGGSLEILENNYNGYLVDTYSDLIELLKKLENIKQKEYNTLCNNSKKVFLEKFTQEKMIVDYLAYIAS